MDDYNFWADVLTTYRLSPDWIKALIVAVPPAFLLGLLSIILNFRLRAKQLAEPDPPLGGLYPLVRHDNGWKMLQREPVDKVVLSSQMKPKRRH